MSGRGRVPAVEIWALAEIVDHMGLSQARVLRLTNRPDFPEPIAHLAVGRIWLAEDVREWTRNRRKRYPGVEETDEL
jgi:prophage regulatory protein